MTVAQAIYLLCALTSVAAAGLLLRHYRRSRTGLLLWSVIGFGGLALNNLLLYVDLVIVPSADLALLRTIIGACGLIALLYGLIWEVRG